VAKFGALVFAATARKRVSPSPSSLVVPVTPTSASAGVGRQAGRQVGRQVGRQASSPQSTTLGPTRQHSQRWIGKKTWHAVSCTYLEQPTHSTKKPATQPGTNGHTNTNDHAKTNERTPDSSQGTGGWSRQRHRQRQKAEGKGRSKANKVQQSPGRQARTKAGRQVGR